MSIAEEKKTFIPPELQHMVWEAVREIPKVVNIQQEAVPKDEQRYLPCTQCNLAYPQDATEFYFDACPRCWSRLFGGKQETRITIRYAAGHPSPLLKVNLDARKIALSVYSLTFSDFHGGPKLFDFNFDILRLKGSSKPDDKISALGNEKFQIRKLAIPTKFSQHEGRNWAVIVRSLPKLEKIYVLSGEVGDLFDNLPAWETDHVGRVSRSLDQGEKDALISNLEMTWGIIFGYESQPGLPPMGFPHLMVQEPPKVEFMTETEFTQCFVLIGKFGQTLFGKTVSGHGVLR